MKRRWHLTFTSIYIIIITLLIEPLALVFLFVVIILGISSDLDYGENHRFWLFHSIVLPSIAYTVYPNFLMLLILLAMGHHCLLDTILQLFKIKTESGYYTICLVPSITLNFILFKVKTRSIRLNGKQSTSWLLGNFVGSLLFLIYYILIIFK